MMTYAFGGGGGAPLHSLGRERPPASLLQRACPAAAASNKNLLQYSTVGPSVLGRDFTGSNRRRKIARRERTSCEDPVDALLRLINCREMGQVLLVICGASPLDCLSVLDRAEFVQLFTKVLACHPVSL